MRKPPKTETVAKSMPMYAHKVGFTVHTHPDGTFSLFDVHMCYYVRRHCTHDEAVRCVVDELWAKYHQLAHS